MPAKQLKGVMMMSDAAVNKGVTRQALYYAVRRGALDYVDLRGRTLIVQNAKWKKYQPRDDSRRAAGGK